MSTSSDPTSKASAEPYATKNRLNIRMEPNAERVAAEVIEGDAIIINVVTGVYYSTQGIGGWIWERSAEGLTLADIVDLGSVLFEVASRQLEADLMIFAATLKTEDLVVEKAAELPTRYSGVADPAGKRPYVAPALLIYRDLKDLLALDPPMPRLDLESKQRN